MLVVVLCPDVVKLKYEDRLHHYDDKEEEQASNQVEQPFVGVRTDKLPVVIIMVIVLRVDKTTHVQQIRQGPGCLVELQVELGRV